MNANPVCDITEMNLMHKIARLNEFQKNIDGEI